MKAKLSDVAGLGESTSDVLSDQSDVESIKSAVSERDLVEFQTEVCSLSLDFSSPCFLN